MALSSRKIVGAVFLGLEKAFNCVSHDILLNMLYAYEIRGNLMQWCQSYLSARSQYVFFITVLNQASETYLMEYHEDQYWVPCYLFSMSMIF